MVDDKLKKLQVKLERGKTTIGIDIGGSSVNIAQMAMYKGKPTLIKTANVSIGKPGVDRDLVTLKALRQALDEFELKKAKVACVINCPKTCVRKVVMPYMPKEEMRAAVGLEIKRSIPFPLTESVLDFNVIEEVLDKGVEKLSVIVAVSPKKTVEQILSFFSGQKTKPFAGTITKKFESEEHVPPVDVRISALLPLSMCLENIIERSRHKTEETLVTIEIGTLISELNIYKNSRLQFSRKIPFSGGDITKSMMGAIMTEKGKVELSFDEAEKIKREYGIPKIEDNKPIDDKVTTNLVLSMIRPKVEHLATEIERSFDFYREEIHGEKIDRLVLFGGGAQLKGLPEYLSKELGIEVTLGNPLADIDLLYSEVISNVKDAHRLVLAIGAALSSMKGLNLLPGGIKSRIRHGWRRKVLTFGSAGILVFLMVGFVGLSMRKNFYENRLKKLNTGLTAMSAQFESVRNQLVVDQVLVDRANWGEILKELSNIIPPNIYLTRIEVKGRNIILQGTVTDHTEGAASAFAKLLSQLEEGILKNVRIVKTHQDNTGLHELDFELQGQAE